MSTPARRAAQRRTPALSLPPNPPRAEAERRIDELKLQTAEATLAIGPAITGDPQRTFALGETGTVRIQLRDDSGLVREALTDKLNAVDAARVVIDGVAYTYNGDNGANALELSLEDQASWQMRLFRSFRAFPRSRFTRAQAVRELVREAGSSPMVPIRAWIPELTDKQRVAKATPVETDGGPSIKSGTGRTPGYKIKGKDATSRQLAVLDATLTECKAQRCSRNVMVATHMMKTQESVMGEETGKTGNDDIGDSQQGREWISAANSKDPAKTTRAFLLGSEAGVGGTGGTKGWKQRHGNLKTVPGGYESAIKAVQISVGGYDDWQKESEANVDRWLGDAGAGAGDPAVYEFTRGDRDGGRETSLAAIARWSTDVNWQWWVMLNTFCYASEDELRNAAPALHLDGDEPWLLSELEGDIGSTRFTSEVTFDVLADRWGLLPGAAVTIDRRNGRLHGRWLVSRVDDTLYGLRATVTLRRPVQPALEPAVERSSGGDTEDGGTSSGLTDRFYDAARQISDQGRPYVYGGGHGPNLASLASTRGGLDCSSSTALALKLAGMFPGDAAIVSGDFAASWGKPGKGKSFTVWANGSHVWSEFHGSNRDGHRFDTSPQGSGGSGPRLRTTARSDQSRFTPRHWDGE